LTRTAHISVLLTPNILILLASMAGTVAAVMTHSLIFLAAGPVALVAWVGLQDIRRIYFLLLATIPFSAEIDLTATLGTDLPDEPLMWFMTILMALHFLLYRDRFQGRRLDPAILLPLLFHLIWIAFSSLLSKHVVLSFKFLAAKIWYVTAFVLGTWYCLRDRQDILRALKILAGSMFLSLCLVLMKHASLGFAFDSANRSVEPLFRNHVNYGALLVTTMVIPVGAWFLFPAQRKKLRWIIGIWLAALFFTYSRGAWVAAVIGVLAVISLQRRIFHWLAGAAVAIVLGAAVYFLQDDRYLEYSPNYERTIWHSDLGQHMQATYKMTDISSMERFYRWIAAVRMLEGNTLYGYGPNSFYHEYRPFTVRSFQTYVSDNPERSTVHNYFLLVLVEQGIPGLLIFIFILFMLLQSAYRRYHAADDETDKVIFAGIMSVLCMIVFLNMLSDLIETDKVGSIFFICVGLLLQRKHAL
jgi:O-antigen ligase